MNKTTKYLSLIGLMSLLLTGCGQSNNQIKEDYNATTLKEVAKLDCFTTIYVVKIDSSEYILTVGVRSAAICPKTSLTK